MSEMRDLSKYLADWAGSDSLRLAAVRAIEEIAKGSITLADVIAGTRAGADQAQVIGANTDGDQQKKLDVEAHEIMLAALTRAGVAAMGSEEAEEPQAINPEGKVVVAIDPLDGSSNIETNVSIGTIFAVLPTLPVGDSLLQPGMRQIAAGFTVYGPRTDIILTVGQGTHIFSLDRTSGLWLLAKENCKIPPEIKEYAINASNARHWSDGVQLYISDLQAGSDGPRGRDFNMRWVGSLVAEATRILIRGGIMLYPRDRRKGYTNGRLRLTYECNPMAFIMEQAGGKASTGSSRVLDLAPKELHQRAPLIFGGAAEVDLVERYENDAASLAERSPLFSSRGLFRD